MALAEGKIFQFDGDDSIKTEFLETIDYSGNRQDITYDTDEFNAVCPFSGLPDLGKLIIEYVPDKKLVELKSLKYYIISFRNVGIYQEAATNRIFNDLMECLCPVKLIIKTIYNVRGGIVSTCIMDSEKE